MECSIHKAHTALFSAKEGICVFTPSIPAKAHKIYSIVPLSL